MEYDGSFPYTLDVKKTTYGNMYKGRRNETTH